jgi:hypothetical protein
MWCCPRCDASLADEITLCPTCGLAASDGITTALAPVVSDQEERPHRPGSLIKMPTVPDVLSPWAKRAVEVGFVLGTGAMFLVGLRGLFSEPWSLGLICMVCSPLAGLALGLFFGGLADGFQLYWHAVSGGDSRPRRGRIRQPPQTLSAPTETCTDITTRSPHVSPVSGAPALPIGPAESPSEGDPPPEETPVPRAVNKAGIFWTILLVSVAGSMLLVSAMPDSETPGVLCSGVCFGLPGGFLLGTVAMLLLRKKPAA